MEIIVLVILIIINGLFVMTEMAIVSAKKIRLEQLLNKKVSGAKIALELHENPEKILATSQIGITLISILTGLYSGEAFGKKLAVYIKNINSLEPYADNIAKVFIVFSVTYLSIILGELIPKRLSIVQPERIACLMAKPMHVFSKILTPFVWILNTSSNFIFRLLGIKTKNEEVVTEEEIKAMISEGSASGAIDEEEKEIIERVFHLGDRNITSMMTHRTDIVWFDESMSVKEFKEKLQELSYSNFPICKENIDNITGVVGVKDLLKVNENTLLKDVARKPFFVPENISIYQILEQFKSKKSHQCFVVNEYGAIEGMITLADVLGAIIGELPDEQQENFAIVKRSNDSFLIDAQISFYDFLAYFDKNEWIEDDEQDYDTLGGLCLNQLKRIPNAGDSFEWRGFKIEIMDMDGQRIDKLLVSLIP